MIFFFHLMEFCRKPPWFLNKTKHAGMNMHTADKVLICFSYRVLGSLIVFILVKRAGQLVEQTNFLTILKETRGGRCLIWKKVTTEKQGTIKRHIITLNSHLAFSMKTHGTEFEQNVKFKTVQTFAQLLLRDNLVLSCADNISCNK